MKEWPWTASAGRRARGNNRYGVGNLKGGCRRASGSSARRVPRYPDGWKPQRAEQLLRKRRLVNLERRMKIRCCIKASARFSNTTPRRLSAYRPPFRLSTRPAAKSLTAVGGPSAQRKQATICRSQGMRARYKTYVDACMHIYTDMHKSPYLHIYKQLRPCADAILRSCVLECVAMFFTGCCFWRPWECVGIARLR